ncbi:hypothetical protein OJ253_3345 [Cryptosporidium canis]|uniref:Uncharacterized protein n=1 Tax=Cryptosporidium canis TaxID=195482 RepID=A0A9D5DE25_9CRYT|nr:hypothetical protein OJ253_3345 [Cryptosporidium canis]
MKLVGLIYIICTLLNLIFEETDASDVLATLIEQETLQKVGVEENEYDKVADEGWTKLSPEKRCQLIIDKLENDVRRSASSAKENLVVYTILRPIPVDDSGACFKRIILWHFEKVELIKGDKSIENYEDIIPVRLLLLGMSPNQIEKEPRDLAEIPEFLEIACKKLLSQKPRMRWPLSGARYHPYISNILGFQKAWIYRVSELLSTCAQHTYQSLNGYVIMLLVSTEQMMDDRIFGDYLSAWKDRYGQRGREEIFVDMDAKDKVPTKSGAGANSQEHKVIDFEIPEGAEKVDISDKYSQRSKQQNIVDIEVIRPPEKKGIVYSPEKLPVYEIPNSVTSEVCAEVGTKEIPGMSRYKQFPTSASNRSGFSSIVVPSNRVLERPNYTVIHPSDRASVNLREYRNFWKRPNYVSRYGDFDSLHDQLVEKARLYWPEASENYLEFENKHFVKPYLQESTRYYATDVDPQLVISQIGSLDGPYMEDDGPLIQPFQGPDLVNSFEYGSAENDPQIQRLAYFDSNELPEDERGFMDQSPDDLFTFPAQRVRESFGDAGDPFLRVDFQGMTGRKVNKQPLWGLDGEESTQDSDYYQEEEDSASYSNFREVARNAMVKWYLDDDGKGDTHLTGRDRNAIKKLFSYIELVDPDHYNELISRGDDYIVRRILSVGRSNDRDFQSVLAARKSRSGVDDDFYGIYKEKQIPTGILKQKSTARGSKRKNRRRGSSGRSGKRSSKGGRKKGSRSPKGRDEADEDTSSETDSSSESTEIPKDIFIQDLLNEKYDFQNILKKQRLKRFQKLLKDSIAERMSKIEKKEKTIAPTKSIEILKSSVKNEQNNRDQLEREYKKNLEEHAKILDLLKKNQEKLREKMEEEHKKKQQQIKDDMQKSVNQLEAALETASGAIGDIEKEKRFLDERLRSLEGDNKHIRTLISMKDNYIKKMEKSRIELETRQEIEIKEMKESYEKQLTELKNNLSKDDTITGLSNMVHSLEHEAKRNLEKIEESTLSDEKIKQAIEQRLRDREKQLELAYQKQKQRDTDYLSYVLQILESKESEDARQATKELKRRILELEERQEELQHTREELEMINNDLIQTVEEQNRSLGELMKKVEDLKIQKEKAQDELSSAKEKYNDITQVEQRLKDQLEELRRSGTPSEEILKHLQKSLDVAEKERMLASRMVRSAELNYGNTEKNVKIAMDKLESMRARANSQKEFEKELKAEVEKRVQSNKNAMVMSGRGEADQGDYLMSSEIRPLNKKEQEELGRLRSLGLDELSDEEKKRLLILGQRQLATMELSVASTFGSLNNMISKAMDNDEIEKSKVLWNQVSDSSVNRMEVENSLGEILLEKIEGQEQSLNNMRNLLEETQHTISELNKQLIIQRELSGEAHHADKSMGIPSNLQIYEEDRREVAEESQASGQEDAESSNKVFEEVSNDIIMPGADKAEPFSFGISSPPLPGTESRPGLLRDEVDFEPPNDEDGEGEEGELESLKFRRELENKIKEMSEKSRQQTDQTKMEEEAEESRLEKKPDQPPPALPEEETVSKNSPKRRHDSTSSGLGRKEHVSSPMSIQRMATSDSLDFDLKQTLVGNTEYETNVNQHKHPMEAGEGLSEVLYLLHDVQKERPPSSVVTCENIIHTIKKNLDVFSETYDSRRLMNQNEVMTRTVLPGMQYDECYNSTMIAFEDFQEKMLDSGVFVRVFVLLTDFMDTLMIGDISRTGYILSNIPPIIYRVLGSTQTGTDDQGSETIETVINNFPSEWIHEHIRTCKEVLAGKSLDEIAKTRSGSSPSVFSPLRSPSLPSRGFSQEGLKALPPIFLANIEVAPRPDKEPCIRVIKRIKQRISEVNGLLIKKRELQEKLKIKDAQEKLFVFTFEDTLPFNLSSPGTSQYCEKYLTELFIKMNNMEWRAKPKSNSLIRLITIPTSDDPSKVSIQDELTFDSSIANEWMGNSLIEYLTNKRLTKNSGFLSSQLAKALTIKLLSTITLKDDLSREALVQHGWGAGNAGTTPSDQGLLSKIMSSFQVVPSSNNSQPKPIPGVILILRTSDQIPPNTMINPPLLSLKPDESPYLIETIRGKSKQPE